jgi:glycosyltransferase involved in cell wall biosynthesis
VRIALLTTDSREHFKDYRHPEPAFGTAPQALLEGFSSVEKVSIHVISCLQREAACPEKLAPNIWYHGLVVPKLGWMRSGFLGCIRAVRRKLYEIQPDIVHGQGTERECGMAAVHSGYPNVVTIHGNMQAMAKFFCAGLGSYYWFASKLEDHCLARTAGVLCNSAYTERLVGRRARHTWRVPNAVRSMFFDIPGRPAAPDPILLNVGLISPYKRQVELLTLAANLFAEGCRFVLQFVGDIDDDSDYGRAFRSKIREAEAVGYARYLRRLSGADLVACFDAASALLHFPSEEAFGLVVAEGLARNLKLFASRTGGVVDIAEEVEGAELFRDWHEAQRAIATWLRNGAQRPQTPAATMAARYHPRIIAQRHLEIYEEVLNRR